VAELRAIIYRRVSTDDQATSGLGLDAQRDACVAVCRTRGWTLVADLADEGVSGKIEPERRPALSDALDRLCTGQADVLVVAKLDRLTRSVRHLGELLDRQRARGCRPWRLVILDVDVDTTTAAGELVVNVMGSVAQWERRIIGERTKAALAAKRAQGYRLGRPVTIPPTVRERAKELRDSGASITAIAAALNADGHTTGAGTPWKRSSVQKLLRSIGLDEAATASLPNMLHR
jgi:DNA invertase Pin-like site-specific DNA recombinase